MAEYCEWSDMPVESCQHCKDGKKIVQVRADPHYGEFERDEQTISAGSRTFQAKFAGRCPGCGDTISENEDAAYGTDGRVRHSRCLKNRLD